MSNAILVPVDFSTPAYNAFRFALALSKEMNLRIILAHYYSSSIDRRVPLDIRGDGSVHGTYIERLKDFAGHLPDDSELGPVEGLEDADLSFETEVVFSVSASIIARAAQGDVGMVAMPPRSSNSIFERWLGSTSTTVSEACSQPVLIVPPQASFRPFEKIVVANNNSVAEPLPLNQLEDLAGHFKSHVHFVHVEWPEKYAPLAFKSGALIEQLIESAAAKQYPFEIERIRDHDITHGVNEYADRVDADLLVVVNVLRNRWRSLAEATLTQDMALNVKRPLLVLHTDKKAVSEDQVRADSRVVS